MRKPTSDSGLFELETTRLDGWPEPRNVLTFSGDIFEPLGGCLHAFEDLPRGNIEHLAKCRVHDLVVGGDMHATIFLDHSGHEPRRLLIMRVGLREVQLPSPNMRLALDRCTQNDFRPDRNLDVVEDQLRWVRSW